MVRNENNLLKLDNSTKYALFCTGSFIKKKISFIKEKMT